MYILYQLKYYQNYYLTRAKILKNPIPYWPLFTRPLEAKLTSKIWPWGPGKKKAGQNEARQTKGWP